MGLQVQTKITDYIFVSFFLPCVNVDFVTATNTRPPVLSQKGKYWGSWVAIPSCQLPQMVDALGQCMGRIDIQVACRG